MRHLVTLDVARTRLFVDWPLCWYHGAVCIDPSDVACALLGIGAGRVEAAAEVHDLLASRADKRWHTRRVAHFVLHPNEIGRIVVHFGRATWRIADGRHRYAAALYLGLPTIPHSWITGSRANQYFARTCDARGESGSRGRGCE